MSKLQKNNINSSKNCAKTRFWKWWWTLFGKFNFNIYNLASVLLPPPLFANSTLLYQTQQKVTRFNWVIFMEMDQQRICSTATFALLLTHSNTNNQQLITRLYPKRTAHFTRLAAALLPLPKLQPFWNPTFYQSFGHVYFECGAWVFRSIFRRIVSSRTHHLSSKFASKSNPLSQLRRKKQNDKKCDRACFTWLISSLIMFCLFIEAARSHFVTPIKLYDLK